MVQINFARKEISCKIVYYGPGMSGKTTNIEMVHKKAPPAAKGDLTSIATEGERTLFFDFLPMDLGKIGGLSVKLQLYTVPGQTYYDSTRRLVLQGADGVVFVADSQRSKEQENQESLENLRINLKTNGFDIKELPLVIQYNKRDLPGIMEVDQMRAALNKFNVPDCEGVAVKGEGVFPTLKAISKLVINKITRTYFKTGGSPPLVAPAKTAGPAATPKPTPVSSSASEEKKSPSAVPASSPQAKPTAPVAPTTKVAEKIPAKPLAPVSQSPVVNKEAVRVERKPALVKKVPVRTAVSRVGSSHQAKFRGSAASGSTRRLASKGRMSVKADESGFPIFWVILVVVILVGLALGVVLFL